MVVDRAKQLGIPTTFVGAQSGGRAHALVDGGGLLASPPSPEVNEHMTETVRT